ncbi:subtilisin-like protease SBT1.4 [Papaver somniferum]|uniref:subtilisin-like protease SBT1.4 n=1 Tax=Papaver somniferum TaxID=3469 RepID=UPI000E6F720D|nr:subtilisin-like protease SBT1.4 [Papaver somniferum]
MSSIDEEWPNKEYKGDNQGRRNNDQCVRYNDQMGRYNNQRFGERIPNGPMFEGVKLPKLNTSIDKIWESDILSEEILDLAPKCSCFYKGLEAHLGHRVDTDGKESRSPRDTAGHGTHCAATAAGTPVKNAGFHNYSVGEAKGIATRARLASYKVLWNIGAVDSDMLAAIDQGVNDGVDVMSFSLGKSYGTPPYDKDPVAIATFGAVEKGILVSCSSGNYGAQTPKVISNVAPWMLTVGSSTMDREFRADVILGDGQVFPGLSLYNNGVHDTYLEIVYIQSSDGSSETCLDGSLSAAQVAGKIVVCLSDGSEVVKAAGGFGMIQMEMVDQFEALPSNFYRIPATQVTKTSGFKIIEYITTSKNPTAKINFRGTVTGSSSSTGPNPLTPEILKPDVIAPGVNILAAKSGSDAEFVLMTGTSMACPHVSGLAAMLRNAFPKWSPAAIKSALMTTAYTVDNSDPNKALNPGLVYDIAPSDYQAFLCTIGYTEMQMKLFVKDNRKVDCDLVRLSSAGDLNYPSFSVVFKSGTDDRCQV